MKHKSRLAIAIAVLLALATPAQAATPKAGAKCTKAGSTATASGKKFTCVKSGTKLVWNKGVSIKVASPKPTPTSVGDPIGAIGGTPTQTPTPSATPTPSVTPTPSATATPTLTISASSTPSATQVATVSPGAFCSPAGATGKSAAGVTYICKTSPTDTRNRWRQ